MTKAQLELALQAANRSIEQLQADAMHRAQSPVVQPANDGAVAFSFDVLINGKVKHTIFNCDEQVARSKAHWIAKQASLKGWPASVRTSKAA